MISQVTALSAAYGLEDLIARKIPTLSGWTADPMDAANITDGDIETACFTGNKVCGGGWQYAYIEWDLGDMYDVLFTGWGKCNTTAGTPFIYLFFWDGTAWIHTESYISKNYLTSFVPSGCKCSKIRIALVASEAATITPEIREFHVWRLK